MMLPILAKKCVHVLTSRNNTELNQNITSTSRAGTHMVPARGMMPSNSRSSNITVTVNPTVQVERSNTWAGKTLFDKQMGLDKHLMKTPLTRGKGVKATKIVKEITGLL